MKLKMYAKPILKPGMALSRGDVMIAKVLGGDEQYLYITKREGLSKVFLEEVDPEGNLEISVVADPIEEYTVYGEVLNG